MKYVVLVFALFAFSAQAAAPAYQNRDEPGRNPYQETAIGSCMGRFICTIGFPRLAAGQRAVITNVSCDATITSANRGLYIDLRSTASKLPHTAFFAEPYGSDTFGNFPANFQTLFYVTGPAAPTMTISSGYRFKSIISCFLSGYTVTLP
jgi:hypothetical protein